MPFKVPSYDLDSHHANYLEPAFMNVYNRLETRKCKYRLAEAYLHLECIYEQIRYTALGMYWIPEFTLLITDSQHIKLFYFKESIWFVVYFSELTVLFVFRLGDRSVNGVNRKYILYWHTKQNSFTKVLHMVPEVFRYFGYESAVKVVSTPSSFQRKAEKFLKV